MREALANELFRDRGVAAPRAAFYRIVVNTGTGDESWGLYTLVEDPADPAMLASQFGGASGYADPGRNGRLVWIPWDNNYSFGGIPFAANPAGIARIAAGAAPATQVPVPQRPVPAGVPTIGSNDDVLFW